MKRAGSATLDRIPELLQALRERESLHEVRPGVFHMRSRPFLHFHDDPAGIFADVRLARDFERFEVTTPALQAEFLGAIDECLESVATRDAGRRGRSAERRTKRRSLRESP